MTRTKAMRAREEAITTSMEERRKRKMMATGVRLKVMAATEVQTSREKMVMTCLFGIPPFLPSSDYHQAGLFFIVSRKFVVINSCKTFRKRICVNI